MTDDQTTGGAGARDAVDDRPVLRVVDGDPSPEELAALVTVLVAASAGRQGTRATGPTSAWTDRARLVGAPPAPGPGAWRASALP